MTTNQIRVSPDSKNWWRRVHQPWNNRDSVHTPTKQEAINRAQEIARNQNLETKVQNKDWTISGGNSYWKDPFPPRW